MKKLMVTITTAIAIGFYPIPNSYAEAPYTPPERSIEELYQDIFVSLLGPEIESAVNVFYGKALTEMPTVYPYQVYIEKAERLGGYRSFEFLVTMRVHPVVGPHIAVGEDRITFYISGSGLVELRKFEHLRDYELPEHWKKILKNKRRAP